MPTDNLDVFKNRTLSCLSAKNEPSRSYGLEADDLLRIEACPICQSSQLQPVTQVRLESGLEFFHTCVCRECHFTFRSLSPGLGWFQKCWRLIATEKLEVFNPEAEAIRLRRYQEYAQLLKPYAPGGRMLDIGAAFGSGTALFQEQGYRVEALETEDNKYRYIEKARGIPVHALPIEEFLTSDPPVYDLIVFAHCLEHLDRPERVMQELSRLMHKDTILYVEVPLMQEFVTWSDALFLTHKSNFSERNLAQIAENCGFEILQSVYSRHTESEGRDIGLVLRTSAQGSASRLPAADVTLAEVEKLYRLGLDPQPPLGQVLRYEVPHIEHFFYTLRLTGWQPQLASDGVWRFQAL